MSTKNEDLKRDRVASLTSLEGTRFIRFKGRVMVSSGQVGETVPATHGFEPLRSEWFAALVYEVVGIGTSKASIADFQHAVESTAPDWSHLAHLIGFGDGRVWNTRTLEWVDAFEYVYATTVVPRDPELARAFLNQLSSHDKELALDYAQAMAPLFMSKRPSGILWFFGDGANGKSALLNALYLCFGKFFASVNTSQLEDGKILPALNGVLGNIVQEGSEVRVEDSGNYKLIGTRQELSVRKLYTQEIVKVSSDFHTIFNANNIPAFADKTGAVRRRTLLIPFPAHFKDDPTFEDRTFTPEFLGSLIQVALDAAVYIRDNGNRYQWSAATNKLKESYDSQVNSAEAYVTYLQEKKILGFTNYRALHDNYSNWCGDVGLVPLGTTTFKRTVDNMVGATRKNRTIDGKSAHRYYFDAAQNDNLVWVKYEVFGMATPPPEAVQQELRSEW